MQLIVDVERDLRQFIEDAFLFERYYKNQADEWHHLCVALDTLGDTSLGLLEFESGGFGSRHGERYLRLYGFLQALFLQQDSIQSLTRLFLHTALSGPDGSAWSELRELRNLAVGHPLANTRNKLGTTKRTFISRPTLSSDQITLMIWDSSAASTRFLHVDVADLYSRYKVEALRHLRAIQQGAEQRWPVAQDQLHGDGERSR